MKSNLNNCLFIYVAPLSLVTPEYDSLKALVTQLVSQHKKYLQWEILARQSSMGYCKAGVYMMTVFSCKSASHYNAITIHLLYVMLRS